MSESSYDHLIIYSDGAARGNPGPAGAGAVIIDASDRRQLQEISKYLNETTNNQAEYLALLYALEAVRKYAPDRLTCYLDSELVVKQLNGLYKIKHQQLKELYLKVTTTLGQIPTRFIHIPREKNKAADRLANQAIDRQQP